MLLLTTRALISSVRVRRAIRREVRSETSTRNQRLAILVDQARLQLGIRQKVTIVESALITTPALHGITRPTLLFPAGLTETFSSSELRHIILHELWHLRRGDVAVNWVISSIQALHWFNPFVWFAMARIREERELACDELALSCLEQDEREGYGRTILKLLERFRTAAPVPALVGIINHKQQIKRRLTMIASFTNRTRFSVLFLAAVTFVGTIALTDARAGEKFMRVIDPAASESAKKIHQKISLNLTDASIGELLTAVSSQAGVNISQSPDLAGSPIQQARFTVKAENAPAHLVLSEALMAFDMTPEPGASGVSIVKSEGCSMMSKSAIVAHHAGSDAGIRDVRVIRVDGKSGEEKVVEVEGRDGQKKIVRVFKTEGVNGEPGKHEVTIDGKPVAAGDKHVVRIHRNTTHSTTAGEAGQMEQKMFVRKMGGACKLDESGKLHREISLKMDENGEQSEGKLILDIQAPVTE